MYHSRMETQDSLSVLDSFPASLTYEVKLPEIHSQVDNHMGSITRCVQMFAGLQPSSDIKNNWWHERNDRWDYRSKRCKPNKAIKDRQLLILHGTVFHSSIDLDATFIVTQPDNSSPASHLPFIIVVLYHTLASTLLLVLAPCYLLLCFTESVQTLDESWYPAQRSHTPICFALGQNKCSRH